MLSQSLIQHQGPLPAENPSPKTPKERATVAINTENKVPLEKMEYSFALWNNLSVEDTFEQT